MSRIHRRDWHRQIYVQKRRMAAQGKPCARKNHRAQVQQSRDCSCIMCCGKIVEPMQYEGTMDSKLFEAWFKERLCPALERWKTWIRTTRCSIEKSALSELPKPPTDRVIFLPPYPAGTETDRTFLSCPKEALAKCRELHEVAWWAHCVLFISLWSIKLLSLPSVKGPYIGAYFKYYTRQIDCVR